MNSDNQLTETSNHDEPMCDFCARVGLAKFAVYDGQTMQGVWAYMCEHHFMMLGVGLGMGRGQRLIPKTPHTDP